MKSLFKALGLMALVSGSLIQGYAIVYDKNSPEAYVDVYTYKVKSAEEAKKKHANYARLQGLPVKVVEILEKGKGASETVALALAAPTEGASVAVQKGFYTVVDAGKTGLKLFDRQVSEALGRAFRSDDHAYHDNVWRGNRGRNAEWKTDNTMYAIVTMRNNLLPLNEPVLLPTRGITGFTLVATGDKNVPYRADFNPSIGYSQYISAETDTRDKKRAKALAKESGEAAFQGIAGAVAQQPTQNRQSRAAVSLPQ